MVLLSSHSDFKGQPLSYRGQIRRYKIKHNILSDGKIIKYAQDENASVKINLIYEQKLPHEAKKILSQDENPQVREELEKATGFCAFQYATIEEKIEKLLSGECNKTQKDSLLKILIEKNTLSDAPQNYIQMLEDAFIHDLENNHAKASKILLNTLAKSSRLDIREKIALRNKLNNTAMSILAKDEDADIKILIATRTDITQNAMNILIKDPDSGVRTALASNEYLSEDIFNILAKEKTYTIKKALEENFSWALLQYKNNI